MGGNKKGTNASSVKKPSKKVQAATNVVISPPVDAVVKSNAITPKTQKSIDSFIKIKSKRKREDTKSGASPDDKVARKVEAFTEDLNLSGSSSESDEENMDKTIIEGEKQVGSPLLGMVPGVGVSSIKSYSSNKNDDSKHVKPNAIQAARPGSPSPSSWDGLDDTSTRDVTRSDSEFSSPPKSSVTSPGSSTFSSPCSYVTGGRSPNQRKRNPEDTEASSEDTVTPESQSPVREDTLLFSFLFFRLFGNHSKNDRKKIAASFE